MKTILLTFSAFLLLHFSACKSDDAVVEEQPTEDVVAATPMPWTFLTSGIYHNNATVIIGEDPGENPNKGQWLDFHDNGTYDYGLYDSRQGKGTWFYDDESSLLELTPGGNRKQTEWRVMSRDDNLILVGTSKHGDNAQQLRYGRKEGLPTRE